MSAREEIENFKKDLHKEIDLIFDMDKNKTTDGIYSNEVITMSNFRKRSEQFYKKYYHLCRELSDVVYENDPMISPLNKQLYKKNKSSKHELLYDAKVVPVIETLNMLTSPGSREFTDFSNSLVESIKFLFSCYTLMFSIRLPKFVKGIEDLKMTSTPLMEFKHLLDSIGDDLVLCFRNAKIPHPLKLPITMLFCSEVQDQVIVSVASNLASEDFAIKIASKVLSRHNDKLTPETILESLEEAADSMEKGINNDRNQAAFYKMFRIMADLFMSNFSAHIRESPLKPDALSTETKMKLVDLKHSFIAELEQEFNRIIK
jgi:hypothetical protein